MSELSERQRKILHFIGSYTAEKGRPPTIREIATGCRISSTSVVNYNLDRLQEACHVVRDANIARGTRLATLAEKASP